MGCYIICYKVEHNPDGGKFRPFSDVDDKKKNVGDNFIHVGGKSIGHQHNNMPEFDVGDATNI